jgi:cytidylate kinase
VIKNITIEREYGSGAAAIAKALAERLGWTLWDHEITCEIARRLKCDVSSVEQREERLDPTYYRLMKIFMRGSYEESYTGGGLELLDAEHLSRLFERVVTNLASKGNCVIVGRASPWFLRDRDDTFRVFIYAPREEKIRRLLLQGKSQSEAEELIDTVDRERAAFVTKYYGKSWPQRDLYHLMLNSVVGDEMVMDTILHGIKMLEEKTAVKR